ncbi:transposase [Corynebacterium sanguinis]|uniref:transposase n=1 Tax=Corynebacterium sanguinis TaxID=2594913 RepID=UPI00223B3813|nr:transposase [Corynebacterium sanguinis]MCT1464584.1 transposase [Corynebacterium sanguinis]MCT1555359.1 transposase [Corynebacterium sanguinis]MCT1585765.1 transposase [Corynebacterium sanguinis]MCT1663816.1 transposase [Corynebacterium sanguinis]MCT2024338.1 transposase [Corynebacterium sanguinis]
MQELPDWTHRREHIESRTNRKGSTAERNIQVEWAQEAYADPMAVDFIPDYASKSGMGMRRIGWSDSAGFLITVITVRDDDGNLWGATAFRSNTFDQASYEEEE